MKTEISPPLPAGTIAALATTASRGIIQGGNQRSLGYLTVWPTGQPKNFTVVPDARHIPATTPTWWWTSTAISPTPARGDSPLYPVVPCRVLDTRQNNGQPFMGEKTVNVVGSACAPSSSAQAYVFNATVVPPGDMPDLTLWPDGQQRPLASTLNAYDGFVTSNMATVQTTN